MPRIKAQPKKAPVKYIKTQLSRKDQERLEELTGGSATTLSEALDQWENERAALAELHDESQALAIYITRFKTLLDPIKALVKVLEDESALFMTPKMRAALERYRDELKDIEPALKQVKTFKIIRS